MGDSGREIIAIFKDIREKEIGMAVSDARTYMESFHKETPEYFSKVKREQLVSRVIMKKDIAVIILAAGKGERMKSSLPKILHPLCGRPMVSYVFDLVKSLGMRNVITVLGHKHEETREFIPPGIKVAVQKKLIGTADAIKAAAPLLKNFKGTVVILYGDVPLLKKETLKKLIKCHVENKADATLLTAKIDKPSGYGRILRDRYSSICGIVEEKDADDFQKDIKEINTGIACFNKENLFSALKDVKPNNRKKEYYLTDVIGILYRKGALIENTDLADIQEGLGINSRLELAKANKIMQARINEGLMKKGINIIDPDSAFVSYGVKIGRDSVIYPFTVIEKNVNIGSRCFLGPFVHLREGTNIADDVTVGNFVEVTRSKLGNKTLIKHFGYIGDARLGKSVNIGAGTVTANFDGTKKNETVIRDKALIGSDTILVAPVKIGKGATTGAGTVVIKHHNLPDGATAVGVPARLLRRKERVKKHG